MAFDFGISIDPLSFIGNLFGANSAAKGQREANQMSQESAREQMAFQERMSSSAHQREVADLRAAGLNPILSANSGASSPGGAMGSFQNPNASYPQAISAAFSAYNETRATNQQISRSKTEQEIIQLSKNKARAISRVYGGKYGTILAYINESLPALGAVANVGRSTASFTSGAHLPLGAKKAADLYIAQTNAMMMKG